MKTSLKVALAVSGGVLALFLSLLLYFFIVTAGERLDPAKLAAAEGCVTVFDASGAPIDRSDGGSVLSDELPAHLKNAFVAVEDKRFYSHGGIDLRRVAKAAMKNLASFSFREGASTISQQLIKNTHLTGEKTIRRKLKEVKLTRALEKRYTKDEILERYLNTIYFGHNAFGIENAARFYFGTSARELDPAGSAMLAALVKSPNRYSPFRDAEKCLARRNFVLSLMAEQGYLTPAEAETAKAEPLPEAPHEQKNAYLDLVFDELSELTEPKSGERLNVYTAYDGELQAALEGCEADADVCMVVRSNGGGIRAFRSTCGRIRRLPASTIKPLAVYAPALEENLVSPATPILDEKTDFGGYSPSDFGDVYGGYMSVRYALSHSVNVPAVKLMNALGVEKAANYLAKMSLEVPAEDRTLALALGGMREGFPLTSLADAYATFPRNGSFLPSRAILRVEDGTGKVLYSRPEDERQVFSPDVCTLMNDMLMTAAREGTAKKLKSLPFEVCAKTGTGGTDAGNTDAYTVAYTSEDTVAVWLGNRDNSPVEATGGGLPASFARTVLARLYEKKSPAPFQKSGDVTRAAIDREEYEKHHRVLLSDPLAPDYLSLHELFRSCALPEGTSERFSHPTIEMPQISVVNGSVKIVLCQTEYYDYEVKRECEGQKKTVYTGKYRKELFDNSVCDGKRYVYSVTPLYRGIAGETVVLPAVFIEKHDALPDDWWREPL